MYQITPIPALNDNYIWMIVHLGKKQAIIVDPGTAQPVIDALHHHDLNLAAILITHHHWDHTNGIDGLLNKLGPVPVYSRSPNTLSSCTHPLEDGQDFRIDPLSLKLHVLTVPGHTLDAITYVANGNAFTGDTLFTAGCGRVFEGTTKQMHESLNKLASLPVNTRIYCGHEYTQSNLLFAKQVEPENSVVQARLDEVISLRADNTPSVPAPLAVELDTNPFLRTEVPAVKAAAEQHAGKKLNHPAEVFATLRHWKDHFRG